MIVTRALKCLRTERSVDRHQASSSRAGSDSCGAIRTEHFRHGSKEQSVKRGAIYKRRGIPASTAEQSASGARLSSVEQRGSPKGQLQSAARTQANGNGEFGRRSNLATERTTEGGSVKCQRSSQIGKRHRVDKVERGAIRRKRRKPSVERGAIQSGAHRKVRAASEEGRAQF